VALEAARRAIVLLKNDGGLLPLDRARLKTIAVVGPNAKGVRLGGYSSLPGRGVDILDGITQKAGAGVRVLYSEGTRITELPANWTEDKVVFGDPVKYRQRITEAVAVVRQADVAVVVIGTESTSREAWADNHLGDVADLELVAAERARGRRARHGQAGGGRADPRRPLALSHLAATVPAILEGFYLGQEGGTAVADVLFGDANPGGKLPITFPRATGQLPVYYDRKPTSFRSYLDLTREPLFPFGHGLSYTTFKVENVKVTPEKIGPAGEATVTVDVTNTGSRAGDEVVQLYVRDRVASVTRPVKLRGFGASPRSRRNKTVTFKVGPAALRFTDEQMNRVVEPGMFDLMVGTSSKTTATTPLEVVDRRTP
jgi:beta-glucosidase